MALPIHKPALRPAALNGRTNGRLTPRDLTTIPGQAGGADIRLVAPAARSYRAMQAAAKHAGHTLKAATPTRSYRPYSEQERIFRARYYPSFFGTKRWQGKRWRKRSGVAAAAVPGTSNHGLGLAVDLGEENDGDAGVESFTTPTLTWLKINAHRFGWSWEIQSEPWHLRYWAGDKIPQAVLEYEANLTSTGGHPMLIQVGFFSYLCEGWRYRFLQSPASVEAFKASGMPVVNLSGPNKATWDALRLEALDAGRLAGEPADVAASYE